MQHILDYPGRFYAFMFKMEFELILLKQRLEEQAAEELHLRHLKLEMIADRKYNLVDTQTAIRVVTGKLGK